MIALMLNLDLSIGPRYSQCQLKVLQDCQILRVTSYVLQGRYHESFKLGIQPNLLPILSYDSLLSIPPRLTARVNNLRDFMNLHASFCPPLR